MNVMDRIKDMVKHVAVPTRLTQPLALLVVILLLAFGLRVFHLDEFSFWSDEGLTSLRSGYSVAQILSNRVVIQDGVGFDTHPPMYYLLIHVSRKLLGTTDFAYRYPSLLAGVLLVSLSYQFGHRLRGTNLGLVTALLIAINPLQIWYASEARMYTLLVLFGALSSFFLWSALTANQALRRFLVLYLLAAALAFYTHYTSVFLIGGQSVFWGWLLWHRGQRRILLTLLVIGMIVMLPMIPFTLPRLFTGAEANYVYVSPLIMLQDIIYGFSLGTTFDYSSLFIKALATGALGLLLAGIISTLSRAPLRAAFLLVYLFAAVFGLMAGSFIKPMYQGVRHIMIGSPAFLFLVSEGILWIKSKAGSDPGRSMKVVWWSLSIVGSLALLVSASISLRNLYFGINYAKDDFRSLIRYAETRAGDNDVIVYNNAILLPLHRHYQTRADIAVTASPIYPYDAETSPTQLVSLAHQYDRIWFVTEPPADKRDIDRTVFKWLDANLDVVDVRNFLGRNTEVKLMAYATAPRSANGALETELVSSVQWAALPALHGLELDRAGPIDLPTLWFNLIWQGDASPSPDTQLRFSLWDQDQREQFVFNHALIRNSLSSWPDTGFLRQSYYLPLPTGMPPGEYSLNVQPLSGSDGTILGDRIQVAEIELAAHAQWRGAGEQRLSGKPIIHFANELFLQALAMPAREVRPGHNLPLELYWLSTGNSSMTDVRYQLDVIRPNGMLLRSQTHTPGATWLTEWPSDVLIREISGIYFPPDTEPGTYRLRWRLLDGDYVVPARLTWRPWSREAVTWGDVEVLAWPFVSELPTADMIVEAAFGSAIELYGYSLDESGVSAIDLTLYWQAIDLPDDDYFVFVHVVAADGKIVAQQDRIPVENTRPTRGWRAGEVLADRYILSLAADIPAGDYQLIVGLYKPITMERLPVLHQGSLQPDDQLILTTITAP